MRFLPILLIALLLSMVACAASQESVVDTATPIVGTASETVEVAAGTTAPEVTQAAPTTTPAPTTTAEPSAVPEPTALVLSDSEEAAILQRGYGTLVVLEGIGTLIEEQARRVEAGTAEDFEGLATSLIVGALLKAVNDSLAMEPPAPLFEESWQQAADLSPQFGSLLGRWFDKEIGAAEVLAEIAPLREQVGTVTSGVENDLARTYDVDPAELQRVREELLADLRNSFEDMGEAEPSASPSPEADVSAPDQVDPGSLGGDALFSANFLATQESGGMTVELARVIVATKDAAEQAFGVKFSENDAFNESNTVVEVLFRVTNHTDAPLRVRLNDALVAINDEQVNLQDWSYVSAFGNDLNDNVLPGATLQGGVWFGLKRTEPADVSRIIVSASAPFNADYDDVGDDILMEGNLSDHVWQPLPEELR